MKSEKLEVVKGSGNVFRDVGHKNADVAQVKAILAAEIIKALDRESLSVRSAQGRTGIAAADFSRIRSRPRSVHRRPLDGDPQSAWFESGSKNQSATR